MQCVCFEIVRPSESCAKYLSNPQAALRSKAGISADIARQEQSNMAARVNQAAKLQQLEAQGEEDLQSQNYLKQGELLNMSSARKVAADQARASATQQLIGGVGMMASGAAGGGLKEAGGALKDAAGFLGGLF